MKAKVLFKETRVYNLVGNVVCSYEVTLRVSEKDYNKLKYRENVEIRQSKSIYKKN